MKRLIYLICLIFISLNIFGQESESFIEKRKFNYELSLLGVFSNTEIINVTGDIVPETFLTANIGINLNTFYKIGRSRFGTGLNYRTKEIGFNYELDQKKYNLEFTIYGNTSTNLHLLSIPLAYYYQFKIKSSYNLNFGIAYAPVFQISQTQDIGASVIKNAQEYNYLNMEIKPDSEIKQALMFEIGISKIRKIFEYKLSAVYNYSFNTSTIDYNFFKDNPQYYSTGKIKYNYNYFGVKLSALLIGKIKSTE